MGAPAAGVIDDCEAARRRNGPSRLDAVTTHMQRWQLGRGGLLITNRVGRPMRRSSFGDCWRAAVEQVGLPTGTRFHDLRHFYASVLISANLHPKAIQARLEHASISETMDTYGHPVPAR